MFWVIDYDAHVKWPCVDADTAKRWYNYLTIIKNHDCDIDYPKSAKKQLRINYAKMIAKKFNPHDIVNFKNIRTLLPELSDISRNSIFSIFQDGCELNLFKRIENDGRFPRFVRI